MSKKQYEIEIKSLLGDKGSADLLRNRLEFLDPPGKFLKKTKQLNHYFIDGDLSIFSQKIDPFITDEQRKSLETIIKEGVGHSVRSKQVNEEVSFVIKASTNKDTSIHSVSRIECDAPVSGIILEELDQVFLDAGFEYQARWSREREEYNRSDISVCIDKNAGYGYMSEVEKIVTNENEIETAKEALYSFLEELNLEELSQERLERMFAHYNKNWEQYYGTDNIFVVE